MMINALIIASEITKGMKSVGSRSMLNISGNNRIIDQQIHYLKSISKNINITIAAGYEYEKVQHYVKKKYKNINILYNPDYKNTNEATNIALYINKNPNTENLLVINGGVLLKKNSIPSCVFKTNNSTIFLLNSIKNNFNLGCNNTKFVEYIFYDLEKPWSECVYFNKSYIDALKKLFAQQNMYQMYIFEAINYVLSCDNMHIEYINKKNIMKISNINDTLKAKTFL